MVYNYNKSKAATPKLPRIQYTIYDERGVNRFFLWIGISKKGKPYYYLSYSLDERQSFIQNNNQKKLLFKPTFDEERLKIKEDLKQLKIKLEEERKASV
jgi:hypothetical protein